MVFKSLVFIQAHRFVHGQAVLNMVAIYSVINLHETLLH